MDNTVTSLKVPIDVEQVKEFGPLLECTTMLPNFAISFYLCILIVTHNSEEY